MRSDPRNRPARRGRLSADLFGAQQLTDMLIALLAVGAVLGLVSLVANLALGRPAAAAVEAALLAGKLGSIAWARRSRGLSMPAVHAIVAYNTLCATASNLLYPGPVRPFTAQVVLAALFVGWFLPTRQMAAQVLWLVVSVAVTTAGAQALVAETLRVMTVLVTSAAALAVARRLRTRYERSHAEATIDALTGIGNRRAFDERLESALAHAERFGELVSLILIDLDEFKALNDRLGHPAGDAELRTVAQLLCEAVRRQDSVFRLGGDEFAVLLPGTPASGARQLCRQLAARGGHDISLRTSLSAGVAQYPDDGRDAPAVVRAADDALLDRKRHGRSRRFTRATP